MHAKRSRGRNGDPEQQKLFLQNHVNGKRDIE